MRPGALAIATLARMSSSGSGRRQEPQEPQGPQGPREGPFESLLSELVRRGASLGFASFFLTEEAVRRAFSDKVPQEWTEYLARQGEEVRSDIADRMAKEFGNWLRQLDLAEVLGQVLERYDVSARVSAAPKAEEGAQESRGPSLEIVTRRK